MAEIRNLSIEQVHGGVIITTQITVLRDDGSTAATRNDRYITENGLSILDIVKGFYGIITDVFEEEGPKE